MAIRKAKVPREFEVVSLPEPYPGLVIRYVYLGNESTKPAAKKGTKDGPYSIFMSVINDGNERVVLIGSAFTHKFAFESRRRGGDSGANQESPRP